MKYLILLLTFIAVPATNADTLDTLHQQAEGGDFLVFPDKRILELMEFQTTGRNSPKGKSLVLLSGYLFSHGGRKEEKIKCFKENCNWILKANPILVRQETPQWEAIMDELPERD